MKDRLIFLLVGCLTLVGLVGCSEQSEFVVEQTQTMISMLTMFSLNQKRHRLLTTVSTMWTQQRFFSSCGKVIWITKRL